jgi:hypothetical protein
MANTLLTPTWVSREILETLVNREPKIGASINMRLPQRYVMRNEQIAAHLAPMDSRAVLALGAAAIMANPEPISRRALFGLAWKHKR